MLIPFAKLKDTALLVSNILRDFDPETMFWREDSPILFPNYDKDGFTPYKPVRKPFSVQIILESFSRSCGYKSYNSLLADQHRPELLDVHLNDLNPAPRNAYYTEYWNTFINTMLQSIHIGIIKKTIPSYLTYRNFKHHEAVDKSLAFMGFSLNALCEVDGVNKCRFDFIAHYYPIAISVLLTALQSPTQRIEGVVPNRPILVKPEFPSDLISRIESGVYSSLVIENLPLKHFLVHEKWHEPDFNRFKTNLAITMLEVFGMSLNIVEQGDDPLDSVLHLTMPYDFNEVYKHGKNMLALHERLRTFVIDKINSLSGDKNYYTNLEYKAITATRSNFIPKEFNWNVRQVLKKSKNLDDLAIYGNVAFWLNQCFHLFSPRPEGMHYWNKVTFDDAVDYVLSELDFYREPVSIQRNSAYQFKILGVNQFIKDTDELYIAQDIPKMVTVYSDVVKHPKNHPRSVDIAKMAVHAKLISLLQNIRSPVDARNKIMGDLDVFEFKSLMPELGNPKLKIKEVKPDKINHNKSNLVFDLNHADLIFSIGFERITDQTLRDMALKPYQAEIDYYNEVFNFRDYKGSFGDLMLTSNGTKPGYFCKFRIRLFDAPYKSKMRYQLDSGKNEFTMVCWLPTLDPAKLDSIHPISRYNNEEVGGFTLNEGFWHFMVDELTASQNFLQLVKDYLTWSKREWQSFKSLVEESNFDSHDFNDFQKYITLYPNGLQPF